MKELKINQRFEKFSPKKKPDEMKKLRESLKTRGYLSEKITTWHGYIVDGHNRYKLCEELNIIIPDDCIEELNLGDSAEEIDVMDWILTHHLSSKSLKPGEKLAMMDEFKEEVRIENEKKKSELIAESNKTRNSDALQLECNEKNREHSDTWTDTQISKKVGVGTGTVARYNKVMNSDDEKLKEQVKTGKITVNKAYETVRKRETRICKECGEEKKSLEFYGNDEICKECSRKISEEKINTQKTVKISSQSDDMEDIYEDVLTAKNAKDQIDQDYELSWLKSMCRDFISQVNDRFFNILAVMDKMDGEHISEAYDTFEEFVSEVFDVQQKFNDKKETI